MPEMPTATIAKDCPRRATWLEVFGTDTLPILSYVPMRANSPAGVREFYQIDVARLDAGQRQRMIRYLSERWKLPVDEIEKDIANPEHGIPILAEDVTVAIPSRLFM